MKIHAVVSLQVTLLSALGGHNVGDTCTIRRTFAKMGTHQLWSQFNMKGRKRKRSFEDLPIHKVMCSKYS